MLRAVIYDLDGTLIDSMADLVDAVNALLAELTMKPLPAALLASFIGEGAARLVSRSLAAAMPGLDARTPELMPRWFTLYRERMLRKTVAYPGVLELLREPPTARAVLTNKPGALARDILAGLGLLAAFQAVVGGDEAERKPNPGGLLMLCERLGVRPEEALLVGDTTIDIATGAAAGVPVCAVLWGLGQAGELREARPAHLGATTEEVAALLRGLCGIT